jgi:hypothetical protein
MLWKVLLVAACFAAPGPFTVIQNVRNGPIRQAVLVGRADAARVEAEALALLGPREITLGRLVVYTSSSAAMVVERSSDLDHCDWRRAQVEMGSNGVVVDPGHCPEVSEAIKIGGDILLRTVDSHCRSARRLIQGTSNPLLVLAQGTRHDVLAVSVHVGSDGVPFVEVFVRTKSKPTEQLAADILGRIRAVVSAKDIAVVVRNDTCFYEACRFPAPFLFDERGPLEFSQCQSPLSGSATCAAIRRQSVNCWH